SALPCTYEAPPLLGPSVVSPLSCLHSVPRTPACLTLRHCPSRLQTTINHQQPSSPRNQSSSTMGSDPQHAKYPDLSLAQDIFNLSTPSLASLHPTSASKLVNSIKENKQASLYRY